MNSVEYYSRHIRFCPECGKELGTNPISSTLACFLHGDFVLEQDEIKFVPTKNLIKR